jgi:hypothetical protein
MSLRPYVRMILIGLATFAAGMGASRLAIATVDIATHAPARTAEIAARAALTWRRCLDATQHVCPPAR